ncbi:MAG TPA: hypothetical protein VE650_14150, partial [Acetobacteraceae bacterium]|nr:hypothetical protein [Acetobacteraceae bacterium]
MSRRKSPAAEAQARRLTLHAAAPPSARARQLAGLLAGGEYKIETGGSVGAEDIALWTDGTGPERPLPPTALSVVDLHGRVEQVAPGCRLLLAGSEAERGYWSRVLEAAGRTVPIAVVRFTPKVAKRGGPRRFDALWIVQGEHPSDATLDMVRRAAAWAELRGIRAGVADGTGPAGLLGKQLAGPAPALGAGVVVFDARAGDAGELVATPAALVEAVASGAPVLGCAETAMLASLRARGAGSLLEDVETGLDRFMAQPQAALEAMSEAAMAFARDWCDEGEAKAALLGAIERAVAERQRVIAAWMQPCPGQGQGGHVLVISDEALNL